MLEFILKMYFKYKLKQNEDLIRNNIKELLGIDDTIVIIRDFEIKIDKVEIKYNDILGTRKTGTISDICLLYYLLNKKYTNVK